MKNKLRSLRYALLAVIVVAFLFSVWQSHDSNLVVIKYSEDKVSLLQSLKNQGYLANQFSVWVASALIANNDIQPGIYSLRRNMGAIAIVSALEEPDYRYVYIQEGLRREEVADEFAKQLDWNNEDRESFLNNIPACLFTGGEGFMFPGTYLIHKDEDPKIIREEMVYKLKSNVSKILENPDDYILNNHQIITIASLIQRESGGKSDMRLISGIIWNRLFAEIPLQIDATLQYIKGDEEFWWPQVKEDDKFIDSFYNTYQNIGLPPGPISNPGMAAIEAALNPVDTDCLFYLHDRKGNIHCSTTYDGHKRNISYYLR